MTRDKEALLKQYELMIGSANQVTAWRQTMNGFYLTVNTTLLAVAAYFFSSAAITVAVISLIGIATAILWKQNISYYRKLNEAKFKVIHEIEKSLPVDMFRLEHEHYRREKCNDATQIESKIPWLFGIAYALVLIIQVLQYLKISI